MLNGDSNFYENSWSFQKLLYSWFWKFENMKQYQIWKSFISKLCGHVNLKLDLYINPDLVKSLKSACEHKVKMIRIKR